MGLAISCADLHAGGVVKAKANNSKYKARARARCNPGGNRIARDKQDHPTPAVAFARNPPNTFLTLDASMESWIGPNGWGMTPIVVNNNCTTGGEIHDFVSFYSPYQRLDDPAELGSLSGEAIEFYSSTKEVSIPHIDGYYEINSSSRTFSFYLTVWEAPYNDDEDYDLPTQNILWQGSAVFSDGVLTLDGFDSEEIYLEGENRIIFDNFTKSFSFPEAEFDSIEVDIRYDTAEEDAESLLRKAEEQTAQLASGVLTLSPNPVSDYLKVLFSFPAILSNEEYDIRIFDGKGSLISTLGNMAISPNDHEHVIKANISHLPGGLYYLAVSNASRIFVAKFIKT